MVAKKKLFEGSAKDNAMDKKGQAMLDKKSVKGAVKKFAKKAILKKK